MSILKEPISAYKVWNLKATDALGPFYQPFYQSEIQRIYNPREIMKIDCCCYVDILLHLEETEIFSIPHTRGTCGFYAFKHLQDAIGFALWSYASLEDRLKWSDKNYNFTDYRTIYWDIQYVLGKVNLWGKVEEHEDGYRAQYAYPKSFLLVDSLGIFYKNPTLSRVADAWAVEIEFKNSWELYDK